MTKTDIDCSMESKAEEVRSYLVAVRGGAPFLSAADGRLLFEWLERGFSVARILAGVDATAEKRRKKMTRGRLTLSACRSSIEGRKEKTKHTNGPVTDDSPSKPIDFSGYLVDIQGMEVPDPLKQAHDQLLSGIAKLNNITDAETAASAAVAACRTFHEAAWSNAQQEHANLRDRALRELAALKTVLSPNALEAAIDEVARDIVRRRYPLVSAREVWDRLSSQ